MMFGCLAQRGRSWVEQEDHRMNCDSDIAKEFDAHMKTTTLGTCQCHSSVCVCVNMTAMFLLLLLWFPLVSNRATIPSGRIPQNDLHTSETLSETKNASLNFAHHFQRT